MTQSILDNKEEKTYLHVRDYPKGYIILLSKTQQQEKKVIQVFLSQTFLTNDLCLFVRL